MFDMTSLWKKMVFQKLGEQVAEERGEVSEPRQVDLDRRPVATDDETVRSAGVVAGFKTRDVIPVRSTADDPRPSRPQDVRINLGRNIHHRSPSPDKPFFG